MIDLTSAASQGEHGGAHSVDLGTDGASGSVRVSVVWAAVPDESGPVDTSFRLEPYWRVSRLFDLFSHATDVPVDAIKVRVGLQAVPLPATVRHRSLYSL